MAESKLDAVYGATSPTELASAYDEWAASYDSDMAEVGYRHPAVGLALLTRHLPAGSRPILDAGAGTGLIGELLGTVCSPWLGARTPIASSTTRSSVSRWRSRTASTRR